MLNKQPLKSGTPLLDIRVQRDKLETASKKRAKAARSVRLTIAGWFIQAGAEIGRWLTIQSEMKELGVLRQTINRALKAAGISPRGRR